MGLRIFRLRTKARTLVRLRRMLRSRFSFSFPSGAPRDVPAGHVAVRVGQGSGGRRYVVPAVHLNHAAFRSLLFRAEEEYGFEGMVGPISLPCHVSVFEDAMRTISSQSKSTSKFRSSRRSTMSGCCSWWRSKASRCRVFDGDSLPLIRR